MASVKKKIVKNTVANTMLKASQYIISFLLFPFIVKYVGVEDYGIYLLVGAFVGYFGLLDFGVTSSLVKYVAQYTTKDEKKTVNEMVSSTFAFYLGIGAVICFSVIIIGTFYTGFFGMDETQVEKARFIAYLVAIGALTSWPMRSFGTVLEGMQRYDLNAVIQFLIALINASVTVFILLNGGDILDLIFWGIVIGAGGQLAVAIVAQKLLPYLELRREHMSMDAMKKIWKFSAVIFIAQIVYLVVLGTDRIVIGAFVSVAAITHYAVARKLHDIVSTASALPASALLPAATELETNENRTGVDRLVLQGGKYKTALTICTATVIFVLAGPIINVWMGPEYAFMIHSTQIYISYWFLFASWGVMSTMLLAQERYKPILMFDISIAVSNIILSVILVQYYGILGVILGTVIPYFLFMPILIPYGLKLLRIDFSKYLREVVVSTYPVALVTGIILYAILYQFPLFETSIFGVAILFLLGFCIYFGLFYTFSLRMEEKKEINHMFKIF